MRNSFDTISDSHRFSGNETELKKFYQKWATNYNDDVLQEDYHGPLIVSCLIELATASFGSSPLRILDAGCGTGLVGLMLRKRGFGSIDGIDLSEDMAREAKKTLAYNEVTGGVNLDNCDDKSKSEIYNIVVCCGVFTTGHVKPSAMLGLLEYAKSGGIIIVSTRNSYSEDSRFEDYVTENIIGDKSHLEFKINGARYVKEEGAIYWVFRKK